MAQLVDQVWAAVGLMANKWALVALVAIVVVIWVGYFERQKKRFAPLRTFDARAEGFRISEVRDILGQFQTAGHLPAYLNQARGMDLIFPIFYSLLGAVAIYLAAPRLSATLRWVILLPFAAALFDWIENACIIALIGRYRRDANADLGVWPTLLFIAQRAKFLFFGAVLVVLVILAVGWVRRRLM